MASSKTRDTTHRLALSLFPSGEEKDQELQQVRVICKDSDAVHTSTPESEAEEPVAKDC